MSDDRQPRRQRSLPRTPVALSVLSLLNERAMHPYEMRSLMRERRHDRAFRIRESSVYDTVARLAERGFVEPVEVNRGAAGPSARSTRSPRRGATSSSSGCGTSPASRPPSTRSSRRR